MIKNIQKNVIDITGVELIPGEPTVCLGNGDKAVKEKSAVVRFKCVGEEAYFLAWTTTPWTLPSNVALCVNPEETYCKVKAADGYTYYMAQALLDKVLGKLWPEPLHAPAVKVMCQASVP